jgi:hypothetical protein
VSGQDEAGRIRRPTGGTTVDTLTANERAWLEFLRLISNGRDVAPTLRRVQLLRRVCEPRRRRR